MWSADSASPFKRIPAGRRFWRARASKDTAALAAAGQLGTPPPEVALSSNRMSPAGIPAFYSAEDLDTAVEKIRLPSAP